ncbi:Molybdenum cofactor sulfurase [Toxocara canis]|uniref:Molybdenum cofactor sulfurase n=1 Tax=Toxocara canis TaxID=6265 RepID=A0A0B2VVG4_TOXCA|nr:Molybdenum cofactor sulfurase [Toxocara canis]
MKSSRVYLDHAGSALASESQLAAIGRDLLQMRLSNPHSRHPTSVRTRDIIDRARNRILRHFNTTSDHFSVVFTLNATQALKMVAECFQFGEHQRDSEITSNLESCPDGVFVYMRDAHTSVVGMRELARHRCNRVCAIDFDALYDLPAGQLNETENHSRDLFVITAMSNFCGRKYPLHIIERIHKWRPGQSFVCLDAASWVSTSFLDLSIYKPDFIAISFYKIFGYPTGVGALLVRNECCYLLQKQYFGGGTVNLADHSHFRVHRKVDFVESLEDGTMDFYGIAALERGFEDIDSYGGIKAVQQKTFALASRAFRALSTRIHLNGRRIAEIYCADSDYGSSETQGPIVAFNLLRDDGSYVGYTEVEEVCDLFGIELRSGCFCNQGACQMYLRIPHEQLIANYENGKVCGDSIDIIDKRPVGALRISFGRQSSEYDVEMFERLLDACFVSSPSLRVPLKSGVISEPTLTNIFIYPVKSCSSIKVERWQVGTSGFQYDRQWMIISAGGTVLSQKRYPLLCLIQPQIENGKLILMKKGNRTDNCYAEVPLRIRGGASPESRRICVHRVQTVDCGDEVAEWIDAELGENGCRLHRVCDQRSTSSSNDCGFGIASLSNEAPYLLINRRSANYLAEMVGLKLEEVIKRFRANLIVDGIEPFVEDNITTISIGGVNFKVVGKCSRCQMICIDQESGKKEANLLLALRDYRLGSKVTFGIYLQLEKPSGESILQTGMNISYTT